MKEEKDHSDLEEDREKQKKEHERRAKVSIRGRERKVQRIFIAHIFAIFVTRKDMHIRDRDKERQHRYTEAVQHFNAVLVDLVRVYF